MWGVFPLSYSSGSLGLGIRGVASLRGVCVVLEGVCGGMGPVEEGWGDVGSSGREVRFGVLE